MIDLEDEKERILEQLAAMVADASVKPELRLKAAGMVLGHERGKAAPAKDEGAAEPEVLRLLRAAAYHALAGGAALRGRARAVEPVVRRRDGTQKRTLYL